MAEFRYCFTFICQQGEIEINALLLAASLKHFLRCNYELVAAIPTPAKLWGTPSIMTLELLNRMGVRTVEISNQVNDEFPICNKLSCTSIPTTADKMIFLDSDTMCTREFQHNPRFEKTAFHGKAAGVATYSKEFPHWQALYQLFDRDVPDLREITTVSGEIMPPYFNSGFIAFQPSPKFFTTWVDCVKRIAESSNIEYELHYLDQIGLSVAVTLLGLNIDFLDESLNYPGQQKPLKPDNLPFFCHYHYPRIIRREPILYGLVNLFLHQYPELNAIICKYPEWKPLATPHFLPRQVWWGKKRTFSELPEAIITGIPRSGTSYLCKLLHQVKESVVINEPQEIFNCLPSTHHSWGFVNYYRDLRRNIIEGIPVENKIKDGQLIEDTRLYDVRVMYSPIVTRDDFLLTTKNTVAYMARLPQLHRMMPKALQIALIRHPLDTIASWKNSFPQLEQVKVTGFPFGNPNDNLMSFWQHQQLQEIAQTESVVLRRALFWRYLAMCLLEYQDWIHLIKYETLVTNPFPVLKKILQSIPNAPPLKLTQPLLPSQVRHHRELLNMQEIQTISAVCGEVAKEFGYTIEI